MLEDNRPEVPGEDAAKLLDELAQLEQENEWRFQMIEEAPKIKKQCEERGKEIGTYAMLGLGTGWIGILADASAEHMDEAFDTGGKAALVLGASCMVVALGKAAYNRYEKSRISRSGIE